MPGDVSTRELLSRTVRGFIDDDAPRWGAALAYYTVVSLAPLVVLAVPVLGWILGQGSAETRVIEQAGLLAGPRAVEVARTILDEANGPGLGSWGAALTVLLFLFGATAVFSNLQDALNHIWSVRPSTGVVRNLVRSRATAVLMVLGLGVLTLASVVVGTVSGWVAPRIEILDGMLPVVWAADLLTSVLLLWLFVGAVFWVLPDVRIHWSDVWVGALATAVLLVVGRFALTAFLARNAMASMFGAASSIFLLLVWIYFSAQVFLLGAEFTQVWARASGRRIRPESYAKSFRVVEADDDE
ncbi:MAG: YihY/virulence factor BrkB family protein [Longimicrobiales bacterium]